MIPDIPFVQATFAKFNALCFEGALPPIRIVLTRARTFLGKVTFKRRRGLFSIHNEDFCMRISTSFDLPVEEWEDVVIHEMIHYRIALAGIRDTSAHGQVFREMMNRINADYGRHLTVRHCIAAGTDSGQARLNHICVSHLKDGRLGITSCAEAKVAEIDRALPRRYRLESRAWYTSLDPFFNRYPRSRKACIYKISPSALEAHLAGAEPYEP